MQSLTYTLQRPERPGGVKRGEITFNGHIEEVEYQPQESYGLLLCERSPEDRAARLAELLGG